MPTTQIHFYPPRSRSTSNMSFFPFWLKFNDFLQETLWISTPGTIKDKICRHTTLECKEKFSPLPPSLYLWADVILMFAGGVQQLGPGQWHSKTGCLKLPRLGTSSPGALRPRVQPAHGPEEQVTDLAREAAVGFNYGSCLLRLGSFFRGTSSFSFQITCFSCQPGKFVTVNFQTSWNQPPH